MLETIDSQTERIEVLERRQAAMFRLIELFSERIDQSDAPPAAPPRT